MKPLDPRARSRRTAAGTASRASLLAFVLTGCIPGIRPATAGPESSSFGAALAHITVENRTSHRLTIAFRAAAGAGREVAIGAVQPGASRGLAPVPAGEALILIARAEGIGELSLDARSFTIDQRWLWRIPRDAQFRDRDGR